MPIVSMLGPEICKPPYENKRDCYQQIVQYMKGGDESQGKVLCLYGLRQTGRSMMMRQCIFEMSQDEKEHTAYIHAGDWRRDMDDLYGVMQDLHSQGISNFFIDEATSLQRFCTRSADLADKYAGAYGGRVVITGPESLAMKFASYEALRDKAVFVNTSYVPFAEYHRILGKPLGHYIEFGGTVSDIYADREYRRPCDTYIGAAISGNIRRSLLCAGEGRNAPWPTSIDTENPKELWNVVKGIINAFCDQTLLGKSPGDFSDIGEPEMIGEVIGYLRDLGLLISIPRYRSLLRRDRIEDLDVLLHPAMVYARIWDLIGDFDSDVWPKTKEGLGWYEHKRRQHDIAVAAKDRIMKHVILADVFKALTAESDDSGRFYVSLLPGSNREDGLAEEDHLIVVDTKGNKSFVFDAMCYDKTNPEREWQLEDFDFRSRIYVEKNFAPIEKMGIIYTGPSRACGNIEYLNVEEFLKNRRSPAIGEG